ncbi:LTA synthase family protein [Bacillus sp. OAE603]|uniref:LTA synthase family protein n=1 Tax=Gottfriedia sp. OAE603 TaxID=2663872 RepID=UPI001789601A
MEIYEQKLEKKPSIAMKIVNYNDLYLVFLLPLLGFILGEALFRGSLVEFSNWLINRSKEGMLNYFLLFGITNLFYFLNKKAYVFLGFLTILITSLVGYVSGVKVDIRGEPLLPTDFSLGREAADITKYLNIENLYIVLSTFGALLLIGIVLTIMVKNEKYNVPKRLGITIFSIITLLAIIYDRPIPITENLGIETITWDQKMHSNQNGYVLGFALDARWLNIKEPSHYSKNNVEKILNKYENNTNGQVEKKPNIIFLQSEAFWDPTLMGKEYFSKDPIPYFHSLQKTATSGTMISPVYGGGTVNTEFEAITGLSTQILPNGAIAFAQYVHQPVYSVPTVLNQIGYKTTGIHTYNSWFYRRNEVYKDLGFNNFIGQEFFLNPEHRREFIADNELSNRIAKEIKSSNSKDYIYAVSMENHGPYSLDKNNENAIKVNKELSKESKDTLETYTQTLSDVDKALKLLIDKLKEIDEPTILVFYGDHLPMLGQDFQVYKEMEFYKDVSTYKGYNKMHSVPAIVWSNFLPKQKDFRLSANMLPSYVLDLVNLNNDRFYSFMSDMRQHGQAVTTIPSFAKNENQNQKWIDKYKLLQYDILFGSKFFDKNKLLNKNEDFYFGSEPLKINKVLPSVVSKDLDNQQLLLQGENFSSFTKAYLGDKGLKTTVIDEKNLKVNIPKGILNEGKVVELTLIISDSMDKELLKSNKFPLKLVSSSDYKTTIEAQSKSVDLNKVSWEVFLEPEKYTIVRANIGESDVPYEFSLNGVTFKDKFADSMDKEGLSDLYPNGYLYVSINKDKLFQNGTNLTPDRLQEFFKVNNATLKLLK